MSGENLLIHSMAEFKSVTIPLLDLIQAKTVCEIGSEHGGNSHVLYDWVSEKKEERKLISIDPAPSPSFVEWMKSSDSRSFEYVPKMSIDAISEVESPDAWFIDGDHNWYTVSNELNLICNNARKNNKPMLIFLHDVSWPWAFRDLYYNPKQIPREFLQPHTWTHGVTLDNPGIIDGGFRGCGAFACAVKEGGPQNGVMTAIDDFLALHSKEFCFAHVPGVFGLGVIFDMTHPFGEAIATALMPYHNNQLIATLERNRLKNYLKVIALQDECNKLRESLMKSESRSV